MPNIRDTSSAPDGVRRTKATRYGIVAVVVFGLLAGAYAWRSRSAGVAPQQDQVVSSPANADGTFQATPDQIASFQIQAVVARAFQTTWTTEGKIGVNLDRTTPVYSPFSGRVTRIQSALGDKVRRGQPLFQVEATEFVQGQNDLVAAVATVESSKGQLAQARINEQRKHAMFEAKAGPMQDWQQSQADLIVATSNLRSAEIALNLVRNRLRILGKSDAEIGRLERASRMDPTAAVVAPIDGTVTDRQIGPGQYVQAGAGTAVYTIGDLSVLWLIGNVRETDAPFMKVGEAVEVQVLALPDRVFSARLSYIAPNVDPVTRRVAVRAEIDNASQMLKPEMYARFRITSGSEQTAAAVPAGAIVYEGASARVWVVREGNRIELREIVPGRSDAGLVEVRSGLQPGERVVTSGTLFIDRAVRRTMEQAGQ